MITEQGTKMIHALLSQGNTGSITAIGIGSGTSNPSITQTSLDSEYTRKSTTTTVFNYENQVGAIVEATWNSVDASGIGRITENGLFVDASTGSMFSRAKHDAVILGDGSEYTFERTVVFE